MSSFQNLVRLGIRDSVKQSLSLLLTFSFAGAGENSADEVTTSQGKVQWVCLLSNQ